MYKKLEPETINRILEAGIDTFASEGPDKASISAIAKKAGVSVGVIYKYYDDKESFFLECVSYSLKQLDKALSDISFEDDIRLYIEKIIEALMEHAQNHANQNALYNEITSGSCRKYADFLAQKIESGTSVAYTNIIEHARKTGKISENQDSRFLAFYLDNLLMTLQFSFCCQYYRKRMEIFLGEDLMQDKKAIAETLAQFILNAFKVCKE